MKSQTPVKEARLKKSPEMENGRKANILLVDDHEDNLFALEAILKDLNQNLVKARSGKEALKHLLNQNFAVVLLDVKMPEMDGFETALMIRERDKSRDTPIIFVSGIHMQESHIFKGYSLGAVDYIVKPFVPEILKSKVAVFVDLMKKTELIKRQVVELKKAHDELELRVKERTSELSHSNSELEQFAYVISHDLQEPLRMVTSYAQLLEKRYKGQLDSNANRFIDYMVAGAIRMKELILDLLDYGRINSQPKAFSTVDCASVFDKAVDNLKIAIKEKNASIKCDPLPKVTGDFAQLVALFQNLIMNGLKFNDNLQPAVHVSVKKNQQEHLFSVRDNGIGIEPQYQARIFEVFQRLHTREEYEGTGIGLAVCKKIVERCGGRIWVDSKLGEGSTFYFTIPLNKEG